ncbi:MAG TPA: DUF4258 domain-containing protein [Syntrophorhabdaceae bacterium]|nr:DUF4258 domain-containing protein [Syntrophorhabdaceae bacterium]
MDIVKSKNNVPIRLTEERWIHIVENHDEVAGYYEEVLNTIEDPDIIIEGYKGALIALKKIDNKFLAVIYKELSKEDGFIITAYFTSKIKLKEEVIIWQKKS